MGEPDLTPASEPLSIADLLDRYDGDLAEATPEELQEVSQTAWKAALADAKVERARRDMRPDGRAIGGLADLCDMMQGTARSRTVEAFLLTVTDVERLMLEMGAYFERIATDADLWIDRDPAKGFDADEVTRLGEERAALAERMRADAAQVASKADRLRSML